MVGSEWSYEDDKILKEWVDKSACYKWLHEKSHRVFNCQYMTFMIPVIIISTLTGTANFALDKIPDPYKQYSYMVVGLFNIFCAIITTISQFLKISESKEGHNIMSKSWDKFNRSLKLELNKNPNERSNKKELFDLSKKEYDRLIESSPSIPNSVISSFKKLFKDKIDLVKPEICDTIEPSVTYISENIMEKYSGIKRKEYVEIFKSKYNRDPTNEEIDEHFELNEA